MTANENQGELKPCPFCGGEGMLESFTDWNGYKVWWGECYLCGAKTDIEQSSALAIEKWNTRPASEGESVWIPEHEELQKILAFMYEGLSPFSEYKYRLDRLSEILKPYTPPAPSSGDTSPEALEGRSGEGE